MAARYEYDEWGLPTKMYNRYGERVREGTGWIGDLNTGNGTPGSKNEETDKDEIDEHPGNGNTKNVDKKANNKNTSAEEIVATDENAGITEENVEELSQETTTEEISVEEVTTEVLADEVTADITTDLVKENPYRYSGYYFDRKTQFYYLQARYYDPRIGRFISMDPLRGDMTNPLSLNRYVYGLNNPINYIDPTGHMAIRQVDNFFKGFIEGLDLIINISAKELLETVNAALDTGKMLLNGTITGKDLVVSFGQNIVRPFTNLYNNFNLVMRDKPREPRDYEVYKYGESTGEVITIAGGLVAGGVGFKAIVKKLKDSLTKIYNTKKITSGNNKTHANSNRGYSDDADGGNEKGKIPTWKGSGPTSGVELIQPPNQYKL